MLIRIIGVVLAAIVVLSIVGFVVRALRWLLIVALVLLAINAALGWIAERDRRR